MHSLPHSPVVPPGLSACKCGTTQSTICCLAGSASHHLVHPGPPPAALLRVLSTQLPVSALPTGLDECVFFISLVVRLPHSLISCQFWLFFVFKLLLSFFWSCKEAQCVFLCLHLVWKSPQIPLKHPQTDTHSPASPCQTRPVRGTICQEKEIGSP